MASVFLKVGFCSETCWKINGVAEMNWLPRALMPRPLQWVGHESTRNSLCLRDPLDFSACNRTKTYLQENACHFVTNQSIITILVPMERGTFRLPTVGFWSRPLQWVGHESTRKSGELNSDSNSTSWSVCVRACVKSILGYPSYVEVHLYPYEKCFKHWLIRGTCIKEHFSKWIRVSQGTLIKSGVPV